MWGRGKKGRKKRDKGRMVFDLSDQKSVKTDNQL